MSDEAPHAETIAYRINTLGWTEQKARETPIRPREHKDGRINLAREARSSGLTPSKVQRLVREGYSLQDAKDIAAQD